MKRISLLLGLCSVSVFAQVGRTVSDPSTLSGTRSSGRGGATVATPGEGSDAIFLNPSGAAFQETYAVTGSYKGQGDSLVASVVDSKSGPVGGALYYARRDFDDSSSLTTPGLGSSLRTEDRAGAVGFGKLSSNFALGAAVKWNRYTANDRSSESFKKWNFNVGAHYQISRQFSLGVVGQNLMRDKKGLDPTMVVGGVEARLAQGLALSAQIFKASKAPSGANYTFPNSDKLVGWSTGAEYFFSDTVGLRAGYKENPTWNETAITGGATYQSQSYSLDYSFEMVRIDSSDDDQQFHSIGVTGLF